MAPSISDKAPGPVSTGWEFAAEFERLAQRPPTAVEGEVARKLTDGCSVWAAGLRPEAPCHLALALSLSEGWRVLFVSPSEELLLHRHLRLGTRGPCQLLKKVTTRASGGILTLATPDGIDPLKLARAFGPDGPDLVIIDDAHVSSESSYAYRPSQRALRGLLAAFSKARVLACAPARGRAQMKQIGKLLGLAPFTQKSASPGPYVEEALFPEQFALRVEKEEALALEQVTGPLPRPALVLCSTPAQADAVYAQLADEQVPVHRYHAGLPDADRARELLHFTLPGRRAVMVAVSGFGPASGFAGEPLRGLSEGFGLGYGREDLRSIVHLCAPCSLDQYVQELALLSRAPAEPAVALLVYGGAHLALNLALLERKRPSREVLEALVRVMVRKPVGAEIPISELVLAAGGSQKSVQSVLPFLADTESVTHERGFVKVRGTLEELKLATAALGKAFDTLREQDRTRAEEVAALTEGAGCRVANLAALLGRTATEGACGLCDVCDPEAKRSLKAGGTWTSDGRGSSADREVETEITRRRKSPARGSEEEDSFDLGEDVIPLFESDSVFG